MSGATSTCLGLGLGSGVLHAGFRVEITSGSGFCRSRVLELNGSWTMPEDSGLAFRDVEGLGFKGSSKAEAQSKLHISLGQTRHLSAIGLRRLLPCAIKKGSDLA